MKITRKILIRILSIIIIFIFLIIIFKFSVNAYGNQKMKTIASNYINPIEDTDKLNIELTHNYSLYYDIPILDLFGKVNQAMDKISRRDRRYLKKNKKNIIDSIEKEYMDNEIEVKINRDHEIFYSSFTGENFKKHCVVLFSYTFPDIDSDYNRTHAEYVTCDYKFGRKNNEVKFFDLYESYRIRGRGIFDEYERTYMQHSLDDYYSDLYNEIDDYLVSEGYETNPILSSYYVIPTISLDLDEYSTRVSDYHLSDLIDEHVYNDLDIQTFIAELENYEVKFEFEIQPFISKEEFIEEDLYKINSSYSSDPDENGEVIYYGERTLNNHYFGYANKKSEDLVRQKSEIEEIIANYITEYFTVDYEVYIGFTIDTYENPLPSFNMHYLELEYGEKLESTIERIPKE